MSGCAGSVAASRVVPQGASMDVTVAFVASSGALFVGCAGAGNRKYLVYY